MRPAGALNALLGITHAIQYCDQLAAGSCGTVHGLQETYRSITVQAGSPTKIEYLDPVGRVLRTSVEGFDGENAVQDKMTQSTTRYNRKGQIEGQYSYDGDTLLANRVGYVEFTDFDALGRAQQKTVNHAPQHYRVNYTFSGLTTTMDITPLTQAGNTNNRTITRVNNSDGKLLTSIDEVGNSSYYRYNAAGLPNLIQGPNGA